MMGRTRWLGAAFALFALIAASPVEAADAALPPLAFFANDSIGDVKLSPSGRHFALTIDNKAGRMMLAVSETDSAKAPVVVAASATADIRSFEWVNDEWLVYNVVDLQVPGHDQTFGPGLFSVKRDGSEAHQLIRVRGDRVRQSSTIDSSLLEANHRLLRTLRDGSDDVIVGQYGFDNMGEFTSLTPKRLNVGTGRATPAVMGYPANARSWIFDEKGIARAVETERAGVFEVYWRDGEGAPWRSLLKAPTLDAPWEPLAIDSSGRLFVTTTARDAAGVIKRFDFDTGRPEAEALASAPGFDLSNGLVFDGGKLVGLRVNTDAETSIWFDPERRKLQALADSRFPGRIAKTSCSACTGDGAMLVRSYSDRDPGSFHIYRPQTQTWTEIGLVRPAIDPGRMADLDFLRFKARDGLEIPMWVTRPRGAAGPRQAVLLVHGGPWVRGGSWRWDADAQFLASRGYVVLEPEFRGSTGYGQKLFRAGWKTWGTTMQDDLADAVAAAAAKGMIDPSKVCIAGASYGGYAALMAPIRFPDLFRCSVAWVAVSDPRLLFDYSWQSDLDRDSQRFTMPTLIGDPVKDADLLKAAAPLERAAEIKIPMLLAYGRQDVRVPLEHGTRMLDAMRSAGQKPEFVVYEGEGHGWLKVSNRLDFWDRVERFLAKNLN